MSSYTAAETWTCVQSGFLPSQSRKSECSQFQLETSSKRIIINYFNGIMRAFLLLLLIACISTVAPASTSSTTCDECVAQDCTYCRTGGENTGQCVCNFDKLASSIPSSFNTCADVDGGTSVTPTVTTKAGCDYFISNDDSTCESCASQPGCVYCEAATTGFGDTQSGCLCDDSISCDEVSYGSAVYFSKDDCTLVEDFFKAFNKSASIATGFLIVVTAIPLLVLCLCIGICCFCMNKNKSAHQQHDVLPPGAAGTMHTTTVVTTVHKTTADDEEEQQQQQQPEQPIMVSAEPAIKPALY